MENEPPYELPLRADHPVLRVLRLFISFEEQEEMPDEDHPENEEKDSEFDRENTSDNL